MDYSNNVELWTRATVASKMGKWHAARRMWSQLLRVYEQSNYPGHREMARECAVQINRAARYSEAAASRSSTPPSGASRRYCREINSGRAASRNRHIISSNVVDNIMESFDNLGNVNETIQRSITPPCLQESFYMVKRSTREPDHDILLQLSKSNADLQRLREMSQSSFGNVKTALQGLSAKTAHLFPDKLISNYMQLKRENVQLKRILNRNKDAVV